MDPNQQSLQPEPYRSSSSSPPEEIEIRSRLQKLFELLVESDLKRIGQLLDNHTEPLPDTASGFSYNAGDKS